MARTKGAKNKNTGEVPMYMTMTTGERIFVLANLIVDRALEDQASGGELFKHLLEQSYVRTNPS